MLLQMPNQDKALDNLLEQQPLLHKQIMDKAQLEEVLDMVQSLDKVLVLLMLKQVQEQLLPQEIPQHTAV